MNQFAARRHTYCSNAEPGTYGHECGKPSMYAGRHRNGDLQFFCDRCYFEGREAREVVEWFLLMPVAASLDGPYPRERAEAIAVTRTQEANGASLWSAIPHGDGWAVARMEMEPCR